MKKKSNICPNCGALMQDSQCDYCGYTLKSAVSKTSKNIKLTTCHLAHPELFEQEFDRINGRTESLFKLFYPLSNGQYIRLKHINWSHSEQKISLRYGNEMSEFADLSHPIEKCAFIKNGNSNIYRDFGMNLNFFKMLCETKFDGITYETIYGNIDLDNTEELLRLQIFFQAAYEGITGCGKYKDAINRAKSYDKNLRDNWANQKKLEKRNKRLVLPITFLFMLGIALCIWFLVWVLGLIFG